MKKIMRTILLMLIVMVFASNAFASPGDALKVKVKGFPPCVVVEEGGYVTGFDVEIWNAICRENGWASIYTVDSSHNNVLDELDNKRVDVGIAGFTITEGSDLL